MAVDPTREPRPLPGLLAEVKKVAVKDMFSRMSDAGFGDVREGHGCVFGFIDLEHGSRLTELSDRSGLTKQAIGESVVELEKLGYVERVPDPVDGRAKIIKLTERGLDACLTARRLFAEIEREWADRFGEELLAALREMAESIVAGEADYRLTGATASPS
jgi:DNA-binding MarR family transcriptional regulator